MAREGKLILFHTIRRDFIYILTNVLTDYCLELKQPPWFSALATLQNSRENNNDNKELTWRGLPPPKLLTPIESVASNSQSSQCNVNLRPKLYRPEGWHRKGLWDSDTSNVHHLLTYPQIMTAQNLKTSLGLLLQRSIKPLSYQHALTFIRNFFFWDIGSH